MRPDSQQRSPRTIDPFTAVGALLALIALTALLTYAALTLPGKIAAAGGPPEAYRQAATQQAQLALQGVTPTITATEETTEATTVQSIDAGGPTPTGSGTTEPLSNGSGEQSPASVYEPSPTANPFGDWPFTGDSD